VLADAREVRFNRLGREPLVPYSPTDAVGQDVANELNGLQGVAEGVPASF